MRTILKDEIVSYLELEGEHYAQQFDQALGLDPAQGTSFWINEDTN